MTEKFCSSWYTYYFRSWIYSHFIWLVIPLCFWDIPECLVFKTWMFNNQTMGAAKKWLQFYTSAYTSLFNCNSKLISSSPYGTSSGLVGYWQFCWSDECQLLFSSLWMILPNPSVYDGPHSRSVLPFWTWDFFHFCAALMFNDSGLERFSCLAYNFHPHSQRIPSKWSVDFALSFFGLHFVCMVLWSECCWF